MTVSAHLRHHPLAQLAAGRDQHHWGHLNPSVVDAAMKDGSQHPHDINAVHYHDHPPPPDVSNFLSAHSRSQASFLLQNLVFPHMLHDVGLLQGFPAQAEGIVHVHVCANFSFGQC